jgi:CheY-like chemotaxis protein
VITNLVGNALKFTEEGHVLISVECLGRSGGQVRLRVAVEDTGIGIPDDKLDMVFEKFTQADASAARRFGGTGLGLSISKQLVEMMGGEIGVDSSEGAGSTFWFILPLPVSDQPVPLPPSYATLEGVRALVVDDNPVNRRLVGERLTAWGVRVDTCECGPEALAALKVAAQAGDPYAMAIIDYQMPGMDGEKLGQRIRNDPALIDTMMVMLTSVGRQGDAQRLRGVGFDGYLLKPVRYSQLYGMLLMIRGGRQSGQSIGFVTRHTLAEAGDHLPRPPAPCAVPEKQDPTVQARALVAEDNVVNQRLSRAILEKLGCQVDIASNGREAIEKLASSEYDVVFMDCQMPEMDGYEATREIRKRFGNQDRIPIVAMTAHAMPGDREKCLHAGMDDYISKPVRPENFEAALERWCARAEKVD